MTIPDNLLCVFSDRVEERDDSYTVEIPKQEFRTGNVQIGEVYRVAILPSNIVDSAKSQPSPSGTSVQKEQGAERTKGTSEPPVEEGEIHEVDIENIGDQGDGITRVERGFVVIVPNTEKGERVTVEITDVNPNVAFAEVKERQTHF